MSDLLSFAEASAVIWSLTSFSIILTAIRLCTRAFIVKAFGLDDVLILLGQFIAIASAAFGTWHVYFVLDVFNSRFATDVLGFLDNTNTLYLSGFIADATYILTLPIIKCSILAFYKRIAPTRKQRLVLYGIALVIIVQALVCFMFQIFAVYPISAWQNIATTDYRYRFNTDHIQITNSSFQILYDTILLLLPLPIIITTKFIGRDRAGLIIIYVLCGVSLVATIIRLTMVTKFTESDDPLEGAINRVKYVYWGVIEIVTAIICANIPTMPPLFRQVLRINNRLRSKYHTRFWVYPGAGSGSDGDKANSKSGNINDTDNRKRRRDGSSSEPFSENILSQPSVLSCRNLQQHRHYRSTPDDGNDIPILPQTGGVVTETGMKQNSKSTFTANELDIELALHSRSDTR